MMKKKRCIRHNYIINDFSRSSSLINFDIFMKISPPIFSSYSKKKTKFMY